MGKTIHREKFSDRRELVRRILFNNDKNHGFDIVFDRGKYREWLKENPPKVPSDSIITRHHISFFSYPTAGWMNAEGLPSKHYDESSHGTFLQPIKTDM